MIQKIRKSRISRIVATYLAIQMVVTVAQPTAAWALTGGPSQPEFNSFTPIGTSDMVDLASGDFNYNIPIMDVGGYPLNLSYNSGVGMDQEATWVGLGWNLNVGQINRQMRGIPDDFNGDEMIYENNMKENRTVGLTFNINPQFLGLGDMGLGVSAGITVQHNSYTGLSFQPSYGISFDVTKQISVGANLTSSAENGASVSPYVGLSQKWSDISTGAIGGLNANFGVGYNSRQGLTNFNMSAGMSFTSPKPNPMDGTYRGLSRSGSGSISFINNTYTPTKRLAYDNSSISFAVSLGIDVWGIDAEIGVTGFGSIQNLKEPQTTSRAYGYNYTQNASKYDVLDFNKEKEDIISKNTLALPMPNYTHDIFQIQGQGIGGQFRPFRGQVGHVFTQKVRDDSNSDSFGGEAEGGIGWHVGLDFTNIDVDSQTGLWESPVTNYFNEQYGDRPSLLHEQVYYKTIGERVVDPETEIFDALGGNAAARIALGGETGAPGKYARNAYAIKGEPDPMGTHTYSEVSFNEKFQREQRVLRNQTVNPVSAGQAEFDPLFTVNQHAKPHHIAGYKILNSDGARYIYGETAYNVSKREATFAVNGPPLAEEKGTVNFSSSENSVNNNSGRDKFFNATTTPEYAHTYLLSSVLSADYEDVTGDGLSDDDLGAYTKFNYKNITSGGQNYNWRIPYKLNEASFNQGLNSRNNDQKGSIVQGERELKYVHTIDTKTHVAYFLLSDRYDGQAASGSANMQKLDKLFLFSKPEYESLISAYGNNPDNVPVDQLQRTAIKVAHFEYVDPAMEDPLCVGVPNGGSKLTLNKVYFTYRDSFMGKYTPYTFEYAADYNGDGTDNNFDYSLKAYDIWGNYKPNTSTGYGASDSPSPQEFPFVQQDDPLLQAEYASAWSLSAINLPSGGRIEVSYESDSYSHVQDKRAMQMFKIAGVTREDNGTVVLPSASDISSANNDVLFDIGSYGNDARYLIVETRETEVISSDEFVDKYLGEHLNKPIYYRFMLNMDKSAGKTVPPSQGNNKFDYVTGYFNISNDPSTPIPDTFEYAGKIYGAIPMEFSDLEGGTAADRQVNPISKSGWYFGRRNLPKQVYGLPDYTTTSVSSIVRQLEEDFGAIQEVFTGPNAKLRNDKFIARRFKPEKSWIRLLEPTGTKLGGGVRVSRVLMHDSWAGMLESSNDNYSQFYGQVYDYTLEDGVTTSGVATYEPNMSKENPFVEPFYNNGERLVAPRELNYIERPFGESFFPAATVTYSRVTVRNLPRTREVDDGAGGTQTQTLVKHATGYVVNEFYTSKDFPTIVDYTDLDSPENYYSNDDDIIGQTIGSLLGLNVEVQTELTLSQGFVVQTNDMNGRQKKQSVFNEMGEFISGSEYKYRMNTDGTLNNNVTTIDEQGQANLREVGMSYEVFNNFEENYAYTRTTGMQGNVAAIPLVLFIVVIPMVVPQSAEHTNVLHTVTTTKLINRSGILEETIAYDLGASVSTKNLAWDAQTGEVLITETVNEYDDNYFSLNYPAYWANPGMRSASTNAGLTGFLFKASGTTDQFETPAGTTELPGEFEEAFQVGDELMTLSSTDFNQAILTGTPFQFKRLWVVHEPTTNTIRLMDRDGAYVGDTELWYLFRVDRSGYRNVQQAQMGSVASMRNPLDDGALDLSDFSVDESTPDADNPRIIQASAVLYDDFWKAQCEDQFINYEFPKDPDGNEYFDPSSACFNPYVINVKGDYRAEKSFAYLTGRNTQDAQYTRAEGFFTTFNPYYVPGSPNWVENPSGVDQWTFASEVTQFSPFGMELENRDALGRYSAAQFGYQYTLPTAVGSNSSYSQMGFDGFEDYPTSSAVPVNSHFGFQDVPDINISSQQAHTGRKSIAVDPNDRVIMSRTTEDCTEDCETGNGGSQY